MAPSRGEVAGVAGELVGLRAERVEEADGVRRRPERPLHEVGGQPDAAPLVLAGPAREQELGRGVVVHLDADRARRWRASSRMRETRASSRKRRVGRMALAREAPAEAPEEAVDTVGPAGAGRNMNGHSRPRPPSPLAAQRDGLGNDRPCPAPRCIQTRFTPVSAQARAARSVAAAAS